MRLIILLITFLCFTVALKAQISPADSIKSQKQVVITKQNGTEYIGTIISDDGREVLVVVDKLGKIYIPKSDIKSIIEVEDPKAIVRGEYRAAGPFTTRYAFTTNALPVKKGEDYAMINLYGPEVHFAVSNHLNIGVMSTWIASPLVLALKYSFKSNESKVNFSAGTLLGTTGYLNTFKGYGGLHWLSVTVGDRQSNISFSGGYAYLASGIKNAIPIPGTYIYPTYPSYQEKAEPMIKGPIFSVAGIAKVGARASFVFDSMIGVFSQEKTNVNYTDNFNISPPTTTYIVTKEKKLYTALFLMPGMRFQSNERKAFQVSLAGAAVFTKTEDQSFPIPMCSWFYKF